MVSVNSQVLLKIIINIIISLLIPYIPIEIRVIISQEFVHKVSHV